MAELLYGDNAPVSTGAAPSSEGTLRYENTPEQVVLDPNATLLTGGFTPPEKSQQKAQGGEGDKDDGPSREIAFAPDGAGTAPASYDLHLNSLFDAREKDAAVLDQPELREQLQEARSALKSVFDEYRPGDSATREMIGVVNEYSRSPRSDAAVQQEYETTRASLQRKWGDQYNTMVAGAQRVLNEVCRRVPGMSDSLAGSGVLNNERFIIHMANLAQKRHGKTMLTR